MFSCFHSERPGVARALRNLQLDLSFLTLEQMFGLINIDQMGPSNVPVIELASWPAVAVDVTSARGKNNGATNCLDDIYAPFGRPCNRTGQLADCGRHLGTRKK